MKKILPVLSYRIVAVAYSALTPVDSIDDFDVALLENFML
jgi:hypothetical protein